MNSLQTLFFLVVQCSAYHLALYQKIKWKLVTQKAPMAWTGGWDRVWITRWKLKVVKSQKDKTYQGNNQEAKYSEQRRNEFRLVWGLGGAQRMRFQPQPKGWVGHCMSETGFPSRMLSASHKPDRGSRKLWGWVKVCLWPDLKTRLVCISRYFFINPSRQELVWLGPMPGKLWTETAHRGRSKHLRTVWLQVSQRESSPDVTKQRWQGCYSTLAAYQTH